MSPQLYQAFVKFMAEKAAKANSARYALGSKSVDLPLTKELLNEFAGTLIPKQTFESEKDARDWAVKEGYLSETGAKTGVFQCRLSYPPVPPLKEINTASTNGLAREIDAHVSLVMNAVHDSMPPPITSEQEKTFAQVRSNISQKLHRDILIEQILWLEKNTPSASSRTGSSVHAAIPFKLSNQSDEELSRIAAKKHETYITRTGENGYATFNSYLDSKRVELGKKYREAALTQLSLRDPAIATTIKGNVHHISEQLTKVASTQSDRLFQNSATGKIFTNTGTANVSHDKQRGADKAVASRIVLPDGRVVWRLASAAATDAYKAKKKELKKLKVDLVNLDLVLESAKIQHDWQKNNLDAATDVDKKAALVTQVETASAHIKLIEDEMSEKSAKIKTIQKEIEHAFIDDVQQKFEHLSKDIIDSKNGGDPDDFIYYNLLTSVGTFAVDSNQTWSTETIIHGVHAHNASAPKSKNLVLLNNLSVNQWGDAKPHTRNANPEKRGQVDEIHDLVDLSIIQLLNKNLGGDACPPLKTAADRSIGSYRDFLSLAKGKGYYTQTTYSDDQSKSINDFKNSVDAKKLLDSKPTEPNKIASQVILKMFMNGKYSDQKYGMLMQALMVASEKNKCSGCKSANERFASVLDKSINVYDPEFITSMEDYRDGKISEDQLYDKMLELYEKKSLCEGPGTDGALADQGMTSKVKVFFQVLKHQAVKIHTNWFEGNIKRLDQSNAHLLQAKTLEEEGIVASSLKNIDTKAALTSINNLDKVAQQYQQDNANKSASRVKKNHERMQKSSAAEAISTAMKFLTANMGKLGETGIQEQIQKHRSELLQHKTTLVDLGKTAKTGFFSFNSEETKILTHLDEAISICEEYGGTAQEVSISAKDIEEYDNTMNTNSSPTNQTPNSTTAPLPAHKKNYHGLMDEFQTKVKKVADQNPDSPSDSIKPSAIKNAKL